MASRASLDNSELDALLKNRTISAADRKKFEEARRRAKKDAHILVAGKTGAGKSKLVNALVGNIVASEGQSLDPETSMVESHEAKSKKGYTVSVWDSPGLQDGTGRDSEYLKEMKKRCDSIDVLLYCIDMSGPRAIVDEMAPGMELLSRTFGHAVWKHAIVALTHANIVAERLAEDSDKEEAQKEEFQRLVKQWKDKVYSALRSAGIPRLIIKDIPIEPAGDYSVPDLPDRLHSLGYLWLVFLHRMRDEAKLAIMVNNIHRMEATNDLAPDTTAEEDASDRLPRLVIALEWIGGLFHHDRSSGQVEKLCAFMITKVLERKKLKCTA